MSSKYQVMLFRFIALQISFPGFMLTKTTLKIVCFYLKKLLLPMTAALCQSCLKSRHFMCTLHNYQPNLGASSQIQISNSIKFNLNISTSESSYRVHCLPHHSLIFIFFHSTHFKKCSTHE